MNKKHIIIGLSVMLIAGGGYFTYRSIVTLKAVKQIKA
jgi:hypothetical protein